MHKVLLCEHAKFGWDAESFHVDMGQIGGFAAVQCVDAIVEVDSIGCTKTMYFREAEPKHGVMVRGILFNRLGWASWIETV
jgi:hypothetical protein